MSKTAYILSISLFLFFCLLLSPSQMFAQNLPPGDEPGAEASRYQAETEMMKKAVEGKKVKAPEIEIKEEAEKGAVPEGVSFVLKEVTITGATLFKPEDFRPIYEPYLGKKVTFKDLEAVTNKMRAEYAKKGYLTCIPYIPEQDISEGKLEIRILEGRLGEVKVEGNRWFSSRLIKNYIHLKKNDILNINRLQRDILRLNQNADLEVKTVIEAGKEVGTSDITLKVTDKFTYHAGTAVDNQGTRLVGKYRNSFTARSTNLSDHNDSLYVNALVSAMSAGEFLSYTLPVDTYGTKVGLDIASFRMKLGREYKDSYVTGATQLYTPRVSGEIYLSEDFQANTSAGLEIKSILKKVRNEKVTNDQLRLFYTDFELTKMDPFLGGGQTTFSPKFIFSTAHFLGASSRGHPSASRAGTGGFFFKYEHTLRRYQKMPFESHMSMRSQFQLASRTLPSSEQLQIGGVYTVRGYPEGEYLADAGATLNVDWFFPTYIIPKKWKLGFSDTPLRNQIEPVVFMDLGGGKLMKKGPGERKERFLMGLGGGLKIQMNRNLYLRMDWAQRVGDRPTPGSGPSTFHMTFQFEL